MITTLSFYISLAETAEDKSLIERLYNGYERYMYAVAFSVLHNEQDAEDTVHEAFLRIIKNLGEYDFSADAKTKTLLGVITRNIAIDRYRHKKKYESGNVELNENTIGSQLPDTSELSKSELKAILDSLPYELKEVILLRYVAGYTLKETAQLLGVTFGTVRYRQDKAIIAIEELIKG